MMLNANLPDELDDNQPCPECGQDECVCPTEQLDEDFFNEEEEVEEEYEDEKE